MPQDDSVAGLVSRISDIEAMRTSVLEDPQTHLRLKEQLADEWDSAVSFFGDNKALASEFLLSANHQLNGKSPAEMLLSGDEGIEKYHTFVASMHLPHQ